MIQLKETTLPALAPLRAGYLASLTEFQELYLELFVENACYYQIELDGTLMGYAIKTADAILVEFYLTNPLIPQSKAIFHQVIVELKITTIYCKSFDALLLDCCLLHSYPYRLIGKLFRDTIDSEKHSTDDLSIRFAEESDYPFLLQQEGELYETPEELDKFIRGRNVIMYYQNGELIGCGYLIRVRKDYDYVDIGMWVHPDRRKQGVATRIISHLKEHCLQNGWKPICGCAIDNEGSQKTLEKNGFISKHKLIEFVTGQ